MSASDLSGGLDAAHELFLNSRPDNPDMRDAAIMWVIDSAARIAIPRFSIDAIGGDWDHPVVTLNLVLADGRALRVWDRFAAHRDNGTRKLGAGPLSVECIEPFTRWRFRWDGEAAQSTTALLMAGHVGGDPVRVRFDVTAEMVLPPWLMGGMTAEAAREMQAAGSALMGGLRYEQLCRIEGEAQVDDEAFALAGTGMRVRRRGVRNMGGAPGHCQHSALFASGRGFGVNVFWPGPDGGFPFNEAFVVDASGRRLAARVREAPWMHRLEGAGEEGRLVLATEQGDVAIRYRSLLKTFDHHHFEMADTSVLEQGVARYEWDGESAVGLIERCTLRSRLEGLAQ